ncbi:YveK family protein [Paenibacillus segetis]|uniref:Capsular polysaccharide biosynthesis protein YwqC n=1 Tax=Paenibacillus segetis TaxID=1325360 RepID=A0ABQ1Y7K1_9BACL|nr:Wzz/FepE/Etk N-terminal domain-containing protein [Paenibacillus segetis]GGH15353.1 putative capsular polysaccharide biosynthesis protein YwqC [Paenibacillus segetis]
MELKQYWLIVKRRLLLIVLIMTVSCLSIGIYSYYFSTPQYEASAKLIVNQYKDSSSLLSSIDVGSINSTIGLIKTYKEIIKTPRMMKIVVKDYPDLDVTYSELIGKVSVSSVNETQVMSISVRDISYEKAANIANAVAVVFQKTIPELMKVDNVSVLDKADPKEIHGPIAPNSKLNIAVAFMLSLMLGVGISFLLDYLDDTVKTEEDIELLLGVPVLASIPRFKEMDNSKRDNTAPLKPATGRDSHVSFDS